MTYRPEPAPMEQELLASYVEQELLRVAEALEEVTNIQLVELNAEPDRPRDGLVVLADGTNWNPGSGAGFYGYQNGTWLLLG